jgi:hypothetical protein
MIDPVLTIYSKVSCKSSEKRGWLRKIQAKNDWTRMEIYILEGIGFKPKDDVSVQWFVPLP